MLLSAKRGIAGNQDGNAGCNAAVKRPPDQLDQLLRRLPGASLGDLGALADSEGRAVFAGDDAELKQLRCAVTARILQLLPNLALGGLARHAEALGRLKTAGLLLMDAAEGHAGMCAGAVLEHALLRALDASMPSAQGRGSTCTPSLKGLRPLVNSYLSLQRAGLIRSRSAVKWFTAQVKLILERLSVNTAFPRHVAVAREFVEQGAVEHATIEHVILRRWVAFEQSDGAARRCQDVANLRAQVLKE